jgi:DNA-binding MarR family transcriptional regulator
MPVNVEQIAVVVRQMSPEERRRLVELAPELREAVRPVRSLAQAQMSAEVLKQELVEGLKGETLSPNEPFLGGVTLEEYLNLPDA